MGNPWVTQVPPAPTPMGKFLLIYIFRFFDYFRSFSSSLQHGRLSALSVGIQMIQGGLGDVLACTTASKNKCFLLYFDFLTIFAVFRVPCSMGDFRRPLWASKWSREGYLMCWHAQHSIKVSFSYYISNFWPFSQFFRVPCSTGDFRRRLWASKRHEVMY
jgi:hypothetical protein